MRAGGFAERVLDWWHVHGRHGLPWQLERTPYRVWVAEIMLQQTQVATVIPYFERFVTSFPDLRSLAMADLDHVLAHWSGLGYYARARNLHAAAGHCLEYHDGQLPEEPETLENLPGIGRSTANAIVAQAHDRRAPILDGNVKRVLARHAGIDGWPGRAPVLRELWSESERYTPADRARDYTQAIMDLGATVCTPRSPSCSSCPVRADCVALAEDRVEQLPQRRPPRQRPKKQTVMFIVQDRHGRLLMERRPPAGIWGGLWCLPEEPQSSDSTSHSEQVVRHQFTHFELHIALRRLDHLPTGVAEGADLQWFSPDRALSLGLPQPVRSMVESLIG